MNETILQIIPAPSDMWVEEKEDGSIYKSRVVCLALIEGEEESTGEKYRYVAPMDKQEQQPTGYSIRDTIHPEESKDTETYIRSWEVVGDF